MTHNFRVEPLTGSDVAKRFMKVFANSNDGLPLQIDLENRFSIFTRQGEQFLERIQNFEVRSDDVWVITMPKCGTTWMLELAWLLQHDLDYETALKMEQEERCPFLEYCTISTTAKSIEAAENCPPPRVIKSHLPMHLLPKGLWTVKPKIIYVARDPKDATVSFYHFLTGMGVNKASKKDFVNTVLKDRMSYNPFWLHVIEFWKLRSEPYIYFTSFERMKKDLRSVVLHVCDFLQRTVDDEQIEKLLDHLSFEKMKNNPSCNHLSETKHAQSLNGIEGSPFKFIRKGVVGSHKEDLKPEDIEKFEEWTLRHLKPYAVTSDEILFS